MGELYHPKRRDGTELPEWHFRYKDEHGRRRSMKGYTDKRATREKEREVLREVDHKRHLLAMGRTVNSDAPLGELVQQYLDWGRQQGGKGGRPWASKHARNVHREIVWWLDVLPATRLSGIKLVDVERALVKRKKETGISGKSANDYVAILRGFLGWCIKRDLLAADPLKNLTKFDETKVTERRALTPLEVEKILLAAPPRQALIYWVALVTGLRLGEMAALKVRNLDSAAGTLTLPAESAKNRKAAVFHLPAGLVASLADLVAGREPGAQLFEGLTVNHGGRAIQRVMRRADVPVETKEGKADFHSLRKTFVTLLVESGADPKTVQTLARHSDPRLTFNVYTQANRERMRAAVESLGETLHIPAPLRTQECQTGANQGGKILEMPTAVGLAGVGVDDSNPVTPTKSLSSHNPAQNRTARNSLNSEGGDASDDDARISAHASALPAHAVLPSGCQTDLSGLAPLFSRLSPENRALLIQFAERLLANQKQARRIRRPA